MSPTDRRTVEVEGRQLGVSNLDKVLWPATGTTKADLLRYLTAIAPVMLPHLRGRPVTLKRFPDGVDAGGFFEERCPGHRPDWVGTIALGADDEGDKVRSHEGDNKVVAHCDLADVPAMVWAGNLAALELHVPMGRAPETGRPTAVVLDLDPGAPADVLTCARVATRLRAVFDQLELTAVPKTSGAKGLQVYVPVDPEATTYEDTRAFAWSVAGLLARREPELVVTSQTKSLRTGKVLIDWSQNHLTKTTICAYSPRARDRPTVSTPLTWDEIDDALLSDDPTALSFELDDVLARVEAPGGLFAAVAEVGRAVPALG